jgi:hypothetical protein
VVLSCPADLPITKLHRKPSTAPVRVKYIPVLRFQVTALPVPPLGRHLFTRKDWISSGLSSLGSASLIFRSLSSTKTFREERDRALIDADTAGGSNAGCSAPTAQPLARKVLFDLTPKCSL